MLHTVIILKYRHIIHFIFSRNPNVYWNFFIDIQQQKKNEHFSTFHKFETHLQK